MQNANRNSRHNRRNKITFAIERKTGVTDKTIEMLSMSLTDQAIQHELNIIGKLQL